MSMSKNLYCLLLMCGLLFACNRKQSVYADSTLIGYEDFESAKELYAQSVDLDSCISTPIQLQVYDTVLAVMNNRAERQIDLFSLKSLQKIGERISVGQGPNDMLVPRFVGYCNESLLLSDLMSSSVSAFRLDDFIAHSTPSCMEKIVFEKRIFGEVRLLGDRYVAPARNPYCLLYEFNAKGELIDSIGRYPDIGMEMENEEKYNMFGFSFVTNQQDRVAICYNWTDLVEIYDGAGKLCNRIHGPKHFISNFRKITNGNVVSSSPIKGETRDAFFCPVDMGDEFGVLFSGKSESEEGYSILANQILVYGWDGALKQVLNLDQGIFAFAVDKSNRMIYGISDSPEFHIISYVY